MRARAPVSPSPSSPACASSRPPRSAVSSALALVTSASPSSSAWHVRCQHSLACSSPRRRRRPSGTPPLHPDPTRLPGERGGRWLRPRESPPRRAEPPPPLGDDGAPRRPGLRPPPAVPVPLPSETSSPDEPSPTSCPHQAPVAARPATPGVAWPARTPAPAPLESSDSWPPAAARATALPPDRGSRPWTPTDLSLRPLPMTQRGGL